MIVLSKQLVPLLLILQGSSSTSTLAKAIAVSGSGSFNGAVLKVSVNAEFLLSEASSTYNYVTLITKEVGEPVQITVRKKRQK
jgi:hypothetical protein